MNSEGSINQNETGSTNIIRPAVLSTLNGQIQVLQKFGLGWRVRSSLYDGSNSDFEFLSLKQKT